MSFNFDSLFSETQILLEAGLQGRFDIMVWMHTMKHDTVFTKHPQRKWVFYAMIIKGDVAIFKWLHETYDIDWSEINKTYNFFDLLMQLKRPNFGFFEYFKEHFYPGRWNLECMARAIIQTPNSRFLEWTIENNFLSLTPGLLCVTASSEGHLAVLKLIISKGHFVFVKEDCIKVARKKNHKHIVEWLENDGKLSTGSVVPEPRVQTRREKQIAILKEIIETLSRH